MGTPELDRKILETFKEFAIDKGLDYPPGPLAR